MRANVSRISRAEPEGVRIAVGTLGVDVDQAHLDGAERICQFPVSGVALIAEPLSLRTPVDIFLRRPDVLAPTAEAERLETHCLQRAVPGEDQQVGPRDLPAVFLLDRPEQSTRLVEVGVVGPAVERGKALCAGASAATAVGDAVGSCGVPRHADEEGSVVAVVGRPPVLRLRHQGVDVFGQGFEIERPELLGVVEVRPQGIRLERVLTEDAQVQLIRPPVPVRRDSHSLMRGAHHRAPGCRRFVAGGGRAVVLGAHVSPRLLTLLTSNPARSRDPVSPRIPPDIRYSDPATPPLIRRSRRTTRSADEMLVVVTDTIFVASR